MVKKKTYLFAFVLFVFVFELFIYSTRTERGLSNPVNNSGISGFDLNQNIDFCNEKVPLHSQDILERYEHEILKNAYWHSEITILYKRTGKYFPLIEKILREEEVPDDFKYLCVIESGLENVVSPVGASGFWQIMEKTGEEYGLEITKEVDERYNLEKSTKVACKYLKQAYEKFGSWTLAAASYNMGISGVERRLKMQKTDNYYDLLLNRETSRYVFRIVALKEILTNPERYNFNFSPANKYKPVPVKTLFVDSSIIDLVAWSEQQEINYKILKIFNPWLRNTELNNPSKKNYKIKIPLTWFFTFSEDKNDSINSPDSIVAIGDSLKFSTDSIPSKK